MKKISFFEENWNEYLEFLKRHVPEKVQKKIISNKKKYITVLTVVVLFELLLGFGYLYLNSNHGNNINDIQNKEVYHG